MRKSLFIDLPPGFSFRSTVYSHGWSELAPFELDDQNWRLTYVFSGSGKGRSVLGILSEENGRLRIDLASSKVPEADIVNQAKHLLRLDDDLNEFYRKLDGYAGLEWVADRKAGRLLRSATVYEDLVKTICTTNCSWALTKLMVGKLVEKLGEPAGGGKHAFPTAAAMASQPEKFYREEIKAGYRSPYFVELAQRSPKVSLIRNSG